jgi:regulator of protease activity HflC (stomatin/prohibitin superfamily)
MNFFSLAVITFFAFLIIEPIIMGLIKFFGFFTIVEERQCKVYVLFGNVLGAIDEPGLHLLPAKFGFNAFLVNFFGKCHTLDMRLDQTYLRSNPVNSEEGAPMGIGIWYEMFISDPIAYLFKNADPQGSLVANVSNVSVRCLSNMPLAQMLGDRHTMSQAVRAEVSAKSHEWGYKLGSVYIRKVHFRDAGMIRQIEAKVVNRLRQVTSAIKQDGANQVSIIASTAEREAAIEFAKAAALHPKIVGNALERISEDPEIAEAIFEILENKRLLESGAKITILPEVKPMLGQLLASKDLEGDEPGGRQKQGKSEAR